MKRKRKWGVDYAKEVPFLHEVPKGFHDASGAEENPKADIGTGRIALQDIEEKRRDRDEERRRKDDARKFKKLKQDNLGEAMALVNKMNESGQGQKRRSALALPEPVLADFELGLAAKLGEQASLQDAESGMLG